MKYEQWKKFLAESAANPESGTQPNLEEERIDENALIDIAVLDYLWKNLKVPGVIGDFFVSKDGSKSVNDKIDDWFKNNMGNPLVRGLYKSMMLMGSPPDRYRHDKNWEKERGK